MEPRDPKSILKLVPVFLVLAAAFIAAIWVGIAYNDAKNANVPQGSAQVVQLLNDHADPNTLIIKSGETVQFTAKDGKEHQLSQEQGNGINSENFSDQWRVTFSKTGVYKFKDNLSPGIVIDITVLDAQ